MSIGDAEDYYQDLNLEGAKGEVAEKIFKEIRERLHFLVSVGLNYLSLSRSAETLSGGEAADWLGISNWCRAYGRNVCAR